MSVNIDYPKTTRILAICSGCGISNEAFIKTHLERNEAIVFFCELRKWRIDTPWENGQQISEIYCVFCQEKAAQIPLFSAQENQQ